MPVASADGGAPGQAAPPPPPLAGCGSAAASANAGPADLFPCDSPWYKDVSGALVSSESASMLAEVSNRGGWGLSNHFQIGFGFALLRGGAAVRVPVTVGSSGSSDGNAYYTGESDTPWSVPKPPGGQLENDSSYSCPQTWSGSTWTNAADCHLSAIDEERHLLIELYGAHWDANAGRFFAQQESVWNLGWSYGKGERGRGCTSADAAGLPIAAGVIGIRETRAAAVSGGSLAHALRFILPNDRTRRAYVAPASHFQSEAQLTSSGPPYGARFRLKSSFDMNRLSTPGAKVVARTLQRYGMILADGGETALGADDENFYKQQDPSLTWSGVLGPRDLDGLQVSDFEVVDYDPSTLVTTSGCGLDGTPLQPVAPKGRAAHNHGVPLRHRRVRATPRSPVL